MRQITIFYDNTWFTFSWLKKLFIEKEKFAEYGYAIEIKGPTFYIPKAYKIFATLESKEAYMRAFSQKYDIVFLAYHHPKGICGMSAQDRRDCLKALRQNSNKIIWLDTADSPGTCLFDVLPFVDYYLKKQLYADKQNYKKHLYCDRLYTDYYHEQEGIENITKVGEFDLLPNQYDSKLGISWNIGLGDMFAYSFIRRVTGRHSFQETPLNSPKAKREIDLHFRGSTTDSIYSYQRRRTLEYLKSCKYRTVDYSIDPHGKAYRDEMRSSHICISPYNFGEICIRDFEAFFSGCILLKPNMDHLDTYPNWYLKNETYIPFEWDFSDLEDQVDAIIKNHYEGYIEIAEHSQKMFMDYRESEEKRYEFVERILHVIGENT